MKNKHDQNKNDNRSTNPHEEEIKLGKETSKQSICNRDRQEDLRHRVRLAWKRLWGYLY